jgi:WS/DGAT/MGAT family acyltransferase
MDRLSLLDAEFLHIEDGVAHMHIAGVSVFEGPPPPREGVEDLLASKLHLIPRYRQRVQFVPLELGRPVWVDDPHFNLHYHVRHTALPDPGGDGELCRLMARIMSQRLDRERPLWEAWVVEGLAEERWALISKVHHCMVDGISGVDLLTVLLDLQREADGPAAEPWTPAPAPSALAMVTNAWRGLAQDVGALALRAPGAVRDALGTLRAARDTGEGLIRFGRHLTGTPPLSIEGRIGPHRRWAHSSAAIDDVRTIRKSFGGTLNDVVLAAVAGGYRDLLLARGEEADTAVVRTLVPVSLRSVDSRGVLDNEVSAMLLELPVHISDPIQRLQAVREQMRELKQSHMAEAGGVVTAAGNLAPPMVVGTVTRLVSRVLHRLPQRSVNTVTTNVPGPQFPLYCLGREMLAYYPFVPIMHGVRIGTAILSYNGQLAFGITGDYDTAPDVDRLAAAIVAGIDELREFA